MHQSLTLPRALSSFDYPWIADQGDGTYRNPILYADYPDPDVIADGGDFFMVVSSFHCTPGLPILHSRDLVNWRIINHAVGNLPDPRFSAAQPGCGIWAPSIRQHAGLFWIFFCMPDEGIYCTTARRPAEKWSPPHLVCEGKGLIDPCPLWDDDGNAYLVHAYAASRAGVKDKLRIRPMAVDGSKLLGDGHIVFDDCKNHPTVEGPKFLKRNGYYYILAPAGGVETGWQLALRSRQVYGPYQERILLDQGATSVNGPHQGALVETPAGEWWFLHFQDAKPYGRLLHLQPARWEDDWPVLGVNHNGSGIGEPVLHHASPSVVSSNSAPANNDDSSPIAPQTSDEFDSPHLGLQWHWNANHDRNWWSLTARPGWLRLFPQPVSRDSDDGAIDWAAVPNLLLQKFPARSFTAETRVDFRPPDVDQLAGIAVIGKRCAALCLRKRDVQRDGEPEMELACLIDGVTVAASRLPCGPIVLRIAVDAGGACSFSYGADDSGYRALPVQFQAVEGVWVGAKIGLFAIQSRESSGAAANSAHADFDFLRFGSGATPHEG